MSRYAVLGHLGAGVNRTGAGVPGRALRRLQTRDATADAPPRRYAWPSVLALALMPGVLTAAFTLAARPLFTRWGFPPDIALTLSPVTALELLYLLHCGRRRTGHLSLSGVVAYRRRLPVLLLIGLVVALLTVAVLINLAMAPLVDYLDAHVFPRLSQWLGGTDPAGLHRYSQATVLSYFASNLVLNGLFDPFVEELYYRGHLLPRMPLAGAAAVAVNALLFAIQHLWQLSLAPLLFVLQFVLMSVMVALRDLRISIAAHAAANLVGTTLSLVAYLSAV